MTKTSKKKKNSTKNEKNLSPLQILVDNHPDPMALAKIDGTIIDANIKFAAIFNKKKHEIIGESGFDLLSPDTGKRRTVFINELINKRRTVVFKDHDLDHFWKTVMKPITNEKESVDKIAVYIYDITSQKKEEEKKLELKEKFYHRLIANSSDIFSIIEKDGTLRFISKSAEYILGYKTKELERKNFMDYIHPDDIDKIKAGFKRLNKRKKTLKPLELRLKSKNGQYVYMESVAVNLLSDPIIQGIITTSRDIAERKKAKEQLDQTEKKFKSIVSSMSEVIFLMDSEDHFIDAHVPDDFSLYMPKEEFIGQSIEHIMPDHVVSIYQDRAEKVRKNQQPQTIEYPLFFDGKILWFLATLDLYVDRKCIIISIIEITARKNMEEDLRESDRLLRAIFNDPETFIGILDIDGNLLKANETSLKFIGSTAEKVEGKPFWETPWWTHSQSLQKKLKKAINAATKGAVKRFEATHHGKNKEEITVLFSLRPVKNEDKQIVSLVAEGYEITKLKEAERETNIMKNYLQDAINSAMELVIIIDTYGKITFWNDRTADLTNRKNDDVLGKKISTLSVFSNHFEIDQSLKRCEQDGSCTFDLIVEPNQREKKLIRVLGSEIVNEKNITIGTILVGRDITYESNIHGRLIHGKSYLVADKTNEQAIHVVADLVEMNREGLIFARNTFDFLNKIEDLKQIQTVFFDESSSKQDSISQPDDVVSMVKDFVTSKKNAVVLIDRLDFLLTLYPFEEIMKMIYTLNTIISRNNAFLFVRVNPSLLDITSYRFLKEEMYMLPSQRSVDISIDKKLYELLDYIHQQNTKNMMVSFKSIGKQFSITKVTTAKRVKQLQEKGLIVVRRRGRVKTSHITDSGKRLLQKRSVI